MAKRKKRSAPKTEVPPSLPPVKAGIVGLSRQVPAAITRPPYAHDGEPGPSISSVTRTDDEIVSMRKAGALAAEVLLHVGSFVAPGVTTDKLDAITHEEVTKRGAYPSPLNYRGFPKSVCTSVNEVICHGIPDSRPLAEGDIINIDVTVFFEGTHGDTSCTFLVGEVDEHSLRLVRETRVAMYQGIEAVRPGGPVNSIGRAIENHARLHDLGVVREFIGHGVGTEFHSGLQIPHYYDRRANTPIEVGATFTIEPMLTLGDPSILIWDDQWTATTRDGRRTAQFEHTLLNTPGGCEVLTQTSSGTCAADEYAGTYVG